MTYIKIGADLYPAEIAGRIEDIAWGRRASKTITLKMDYAAASAIFIDGLVWSIVVDDGGGESAEHDNSDYCVAGSITDNRDGTLSIKMGRQTEAEQLQAALSRAVTEEELAQAYTEGVNSL